METIQTDFAVIGSGIAGLRAAIEIAETQRSVWLLTKDLAEDSNTRWAQGGIAAALSDEDRIWIHEADTLAAGDGLSEPSAVRILVEDGARLVIELIDWGTEFDREGFRLAFTREGAHSANRILHAQGDSTGREIVRALLLKAATYPNIRFVPHAFTAEAIAEEGVCRGVRFIDETDGRWRVLRAQGVLLATGGCGQMYRETTNPPQATGDGVALGWRAGAEVLDQEFIQFHPTALALRGSPRFLLSEALRGEGGVLRDSEGRRFMTDVHPRAELAPRDVVSRAIVQHLRRTHGDAVFLDMTHLPAAFVRSRFPRIYETCLAAGCNLERERVPVLPAAHYAMGGIRTDLHGRTTLPGLYAAGETAANGVHGANRLASNSLLDGLVFGARAGIAMTRDLLDGGAPSGSPARAEPLRCPREEEAAGVKRVVRDIAWERIGIVRDGAGLRGAVERLGELWRGGPVRPGPSRAAIEAANLGTVAWLTARAAEAREETRGAHSRSEYPERDDIGWAAHSLQRPGGRRVERLPLGAIGSGSGSATSGSS